MYTPQSERRCNWALRALKEHACRTGYPEKHFQETLTDLLLSLRHYCAAEKMDFNASITASNQLFEAESKNQTK